MQEVLSNHTPHPMDFRLGGNHLITIGDTGLDTKHCFFADSEHEVPFQTLQLKDNEIPTSFFKWNPHRKIQSYVRFQYEEITTDFKDFDNGHGTHIVGTAVGNPLHQNQQWKGMSPESPILFLDMGILQDLEPYLFIPFEFQKHVLEWIYRDTPSRIFSISWGGDFNIYSHLCREIDDFLFHHDDFIIVVASGNLGHLGPGSIGSPATAKNILSVGATYSNFHSFNHSIHHQEYWVQTGFCPLYHQHILNHSHLYGEHYLASFSGRGPTHARWTTRAERTAGGRTVSYTHLTLPTICSV